MSETVWDRQYAAGEGLRWWPEQSLVEFLGRRYGSCWPYFTRCKGLSAGEIGCGNGRNLPALFRWGFACCAIDGSDSALAAAAQLLETECPALGMVTDLRQHTLPIPLPWPDSRFDLVVDVQTIQHAPWADHARIYADVMRVLKPSGLLFSMHWATGDAEVIYPQHPELERHVVEEQLAAVREAGFTVHEWAVHSKTYRQCTAVGRWAVIEAVKL